MSRKALILSVVVFAQANSIANAASKFKLELVSEETVRLLLRYADKWGVPQPPADSEMVLLSWDSSEGVPLLDAMGNPVKIPEGADDNITVEAAPEFEIGFRSAHSSSVIYVGYTQIDTNEYGDLVVTNGGRITLDGMRMSNLHDGVPHDYNVGLVTALQVLRRDKNSLLGRAVLAKALRYDDFGRVARLQVDQPIAKLGRVALLNEINQITTPKPNFARIKSNLERIWKILGPFTVEAAMKDERIPKLIHQLELTINHPKPEPGSVEAIIERYLFSGGKTSPIMGSHGEGGSAKVWEDLVLAGFDSVPVLIKLLEDERVTNHLMQGFNNFVSHPMRVSQVAGSYLQSFAGSDLGEDWLSTQKGYSAKAKIVREWYEEVRKQGEENYVAENCLVKTEDNIHVNAALLLIAERRHPNLLPRFYRRMLKEASHSYQVADAIASATGLTPREKVNLLKEGIATNKDQHVRAAEEAIERIGKQTSEKR